MRWALLAGLLLLAGCHAATPPPHPCYLPSVEEGYSELPVVYCVNDGRRATWADIQRSERLNLYAEACAFPYSRYWLLDTEAANRCCTHETC
jgi:hypothetical protein